MNLGSLDTYAKAIIAVGVLLGAAQGIIVATGGSFPPWAPAGDFKKLRDNVDGILEEREANRCADARRRLNNARQRLQARPGDTFEAENIEVTEMEIRRIPNCRERPDA